MDDDDDFKFDIETEFDNPDGFPSLEQKGTFIEEPHYIVYFDHAPDKQFGSNDLNAYKTDPNIIVHRVMMRLTGLNEEAAMNECYRLRPIVVVIDTIKNKPLGGKFEFYH